MSQIIVNDEKQEVSLPLTLAELIKINYPGERGLRRKRRL